GKSYKEVYELVNALGHLERTGSPKRGLRRPHRNSSARTGVYKETIKILMEGYGLKWTSTMKIGSGCKVHLRSEELPSGRIIVSISKHLVAVIDGVIHDTRNPDRNGLRCVYGYWSEK